LLFIDPPHISLKHLVDHFLLLVKFIVLRDVNLDHVLSQLDEALVLFIAFQDHRKVHIVVLVVSLEQALHDEILASQQDPFSDIILEPLIIDKSSFVFGKSLCHLLLNWQLFISNISDWKDDNLLLLPNLKLV